MSSDKSSKNTIILTWRAPIRIYRKHSKAEYVILMLIVMSLSMLFLIIRQYLLIITSWAVTFFTIVLWKTIPETVTHAIRKDGIYSIDTLYKWDQLKEYWFTRINNVCLLNIETTFRFPARLIMIAGSLENANKLHKHLQSFLPYKLDKKTSWLGIIDTWIDGKYVPIDDESNKKNSTLAPK